MTPETMSVFFAVLSLACWAATIATLTVWALARNRPDSGLAAFRDALAGSALWLGWLVAAVTMAGSLYYSEVAHFLPCELCWYQRICMYPLAVILLVAALTRDTKVCRYVVPLATIGAVIAVYHTQLQAFPKQQSFCAATNPCTARFVWQFGFVSLPFMALAAFCFILTMTLLARTAPTNEFPTEAGMHE